MGIATNENLTFLKSYRPDDIAFHIKGFVDAWNMPYRTCVVDNMVSKAFPAREKWVGNERLLSCS